MKDLLGWPLLPMNASVHGEFVDDVNIYVHWLMLLLFIGWISYFIMLKKTNTATFQTITIIWMFSRCMTTTNSLTKIINHSNSQCMLFFYL